ncbi:nitronate monooxygenase [Rhodococcus sp. X156]|uniref:nitronate monooxygenase n=1 Tax=Rhodococcus sp. X156 TaxID=2499145 RepID=UPI001F49A0F2|nr:nitronate monooxygenase [Rhodococcus sp. X156]
MSPLLERLPVPIIGAPMAGGPSTVQLAAAVSTAGGLGVLAGANLSVDAMGDRVQALRPAIGANGVFGVNLFLPTAEPTLDADGRAALDRHLATLETWAQRYGVRRGEAAWDDDHWRAKIDWLVAHPVSLVTFHFGAPPREVVQELHALGTEVWTTVTSRAEARLAAESGLDALVVQGPEAGGHRGCFTTALDDPDQQVPLLQLLGLVQSVTDLPLVAAGGLADAAAVAQVLSAGARAAQLGTAFLLCPEAGTAAPHRAALASDRPTAVTRAFSGRPARGIRNALLDELTDGAPALYPHLNRASQPIRAASAAAGDEAAVALWAGEQHSLAHAIPAADVVRAVAAGLH